MKRRNVQMAFVGERAGVEPDAVTKMMEGDEAVDIEVKGGHLRVVVPTGTPDRKIFDDASVLGGELILENGLRFTFEIQEDAEGALFEATSQEKQTMGHPGLSALPETA
jgi:hypothetical protein